MGETAPMAAARLALKLVDTEAALSAETQRRERFEEEVWCAHKWLDEQNIPRTAVGGEVFSLVGRMMQLGRAALQQE
jgi:hypothetical protein